MTAADATTAAGPIPKPPTKSLVAWAMDLLIWGGVAAVLIYSFEAVNLQGVGKLFSNSENVQNFGKELLRPDFADWRLFVEKMWETVQIALWGTFLAVFLAVPMGLAAAPLYGWSSRCAGS